MCFITQEPGIVTFARGRVSNVVEIHKHFVVDTLVVVLIDLSTTNKESMPHDRLYRGYRNVMCVIEPVESTYT